MSARVLAVVTGLAVVLAVPRAQPVPLVSGLDPATLDRSVRPQDDLFRYANNHWIRTTPMPVEKVTYGALTELSDRAEQDVREIIEDILALPDRRPGSEEQQIADLYASMMDEDTIERLGASPIAPGLARIAAIATTKALAAEAGYLSSIAAGGPFDGVVGEDPVTPGAIVFHLVQGGTLMSDRDYYLRDDDATRRLRDHYLVYLTETFRLAGQADAAGAARRVLDLEIELARVLRPREEPVDPSGGPVRYELHTLQKAMPGFDWIAWAKPQGLDRVRAIVITQPSFFRAFAALVQAKPLEAWKAWLAMRYITANSSSLTRAFNDVRFEFFGRVLVGQESPRARWRRAVGLASTHLPDAIGRRYVRKRFPPASKARVERLVGNLLEAYRRSISSLDWMTASSRREALAKLARLRVQVGYPDEWRSYRGFVVKPDDLVGNQLRYREFSNRDRMARLATRTDARTWLIAPQVVNAYYQAVANEIVLPAAILQPPLFDPAADDAINYGGIGAMIGHEIGHAFDRAGRTVDAAGRRRDWWTPQDTTAFGARAGGLIAQYNAYSPIPGMRVNGALTFDENVGDLGGLSIALQAYRLSLGGRPAPVLDGLTGEQRFFLGWARAWRAKSSDGYVRQMLLVDPHAPPEFRTNGPVGHLDAFHEAFDVQPGDRLYRAPGARVRIW